MKNAKRKGRIPKRNETTKPHKHRTKDTQTMKTKNRKLQKLKIQK